MIGLRDYQAEALSAIEREYARGIARQLLVLPTGSGKTVIFVSQASRMRKALILEHRDELINQTVEKIALVCPDIEPGVVKAERNELGRRITVASVQTLWRPERLAGLKPEYDLVVSDEAHHAVSPGWRVVLEKVRAGTDSLHLGVTATPNRTDRVGLGKLFDKVVYEKTIADMIAAGYLCPPVGTVVRTRVDISSVDESGNDFSDRRLEAVLNTKNRNELIAAAVKDKAAGRRTIVFAAGVGHARRLAETLREAAIEAAAVDHALPLDVRRSILRDFAAGRLAAVANFGVLTEGYDNPSVDCVTLARPTKSSLLYVQMVGRGLRPYPGKKNCLVLDIADISGKHRLVQLSDLVGSTDEAARRRSTGSLRGPGPQGEGGGAVGGVLVEEEAPLIAALFNWMKVGSAWLVSIDRGQAGALVPCEGGYRPLHLEHGRRPEVLHPHPLPLDWAQGVVESRIRQASGGNLALIRRKALWRFEKASDAQKGFLSGKGVRISEDMTKGEASDIITRMAWGRQLRRLGALR